MLNQLDALLSHLQSQPNSAAGFSAAIMYKTGIEFGLTWGEVCKTFLGKQRAISRGKYPAALSEDVLTAARQAPAKTPKAAKILTDKKATKPRRVPTGMIEKSTRDEVAIAARMKLISDIARRHSSENAAIHKIVTSANQTARSANELDAITEEYELILASGVSIPETLEFAH